VHPRNVGLDFPKPLGDDLDRLPDIDGAVPVAKERHALGHAEDKFAGVVVHIADEERAERT